MIVTFINYCRDFSRSLFLSLPLFIFFLPFFSFLLSHFKEGYRRKKKIIYGYNINNNVVIICVLVCVFLSLLLYVCVCLFLCVHLCVYVYLLYAYIHVYLCVYPFSYLCSCRHLGNELMHNYGINCSMVT